MTHAKHRREHHQHCYATTPPVLCHGFTELAVPFCYRTIIRLRYGDHRIWTQ
jgi:hypothetical protein